MGRSRKKLSDQPFEVEISGLDSRAMGKAVLENKDLRVYDALPNERILARHMFGRSHRGKAITLEVLKSSPDRTRPRCPHFGDCGACSSQHMSDEAQLAWKERTLLHKLQETGGVQPESVYPPLCGPQWNYRRKARLSVRYVAPKNRVLVGFRERNGRYVADMEECHILRKEIADNLTSMSSMIEELDCRSAIPQIEIACGDDNCALIIRHLEELTAHDNERLRRYALESGMGIFLQSAGPQSIQLLEPNDLQLSYSIDALGIHFHFEPLDFVQVNGELNQKMVMRALELLDPRPVDRILDLFCGLGNFSLPLATRAGQVTGIEGSEEMVERGQSNARANGLSNVDFQSVDLYSADLGMADAASWQAGGYDKIMLDPPRSGAENLLPWISASGATRVLYISCNPETLARDAGIMVNTNGYLLEGAGIINMFPHTPHSEAIALFTRQ